MENFFELGGGEHVADAEERERGSGAGDVFDAGGEDVGKFDMEEEN